MDKVNDELTLEKKKKRAFLFLDISMTIGLLYILSMYKGKEGKEKYLLLFSMGTVSIYYFSRLSKITNLMNIFHVFLALGIVLMSLFSESKDILIFLTGISLLITASRKIFNGCIVRVIEKKDNDLTNNGFTKKLKWDYIFPSLGLIGLYKLNKAKNE